VTYAVRDTQFPANLDSSDRNQKFDIVVAVGPDTIEFLREYGQSVFLDVPIVICGSSADQAGNPKLDSRFTGTCQQLEPRKTLEVALRLPTCCTAGSN